MADMNGFSERIIQSREGLAGDVPARSVKATDEGGCGVVGFASSVPVSGRHIFEPSIQMHNRGNGKGGGIAAASLDADQLSVDAATLRDDYILQIALLDPSSEKEVEEAFIAPRFRIDEKTQIRPEADHRDFGLDLRPPDIVRYFVRADEDALARFAEEGGLADGPTRAAEDEFVYQNSFRLNQRFYASLGDKRAFVLSHARNLVIFKIVGYAEQVVQYYGLDDFKARIWIAHQRYPTKGRMWHPAGSHPFIGMNEALVHNGDFANYFSISEYLRQHNVFPQFLTDTEVSVLLFDLLHRVYRYPTEYVIECMAPTTELDFDRLPEAKKKLYRSIQSMHIHGSPDGPWFFIIAKSDPDNDNYQLLGITDTSMLRPQVFALQEGDATIGLVASEKQAIDATLHSLAKEDSRFRPVADRYWAARGGSHTDGGAFIFNVKVDADDSDLACTDKFGSPITGSSGTWRIDADADPAAPEGASAIESDLETIADTGGRSRFFERVIAEITSWDFNNLRWLAGKLAKAARDNDLLIDPVLETLALLNDRRYDCGSMKRSVVLQILRETICTILDRVPAIGDRGAGHICRIEWATRDTLRAPSDDETTLVIEADGFPPEGDDCDATLIVRAYELGWRRFIEYGLRGQRFTGCGFGPDTRDVRIDLFGSSGDYLASGIDGMEIHVHDSGQDQIGQIMKSGKLVVHGDVGQTFMYGAKGGDVYVMGNAAGRPLINAVGRPRVVINGTCLDFLAESFMAGDPHKGGGFVVLNGIEFDDNGRIHEQESPYPGSNLFSLASGGAIFVRDPHKKLVPEQLNGGEFVDLSDADWNLILPYLETNERYFGISIAEDLLTVGGVSRQPREVYRKVRALKLAVLAREDDTE